MGEMDPGATVDKRWDLAIDRILNSGTMSPHMTAFWQYIDGEIPWEKFCEEMP